MERPMRRVWSFVLRTMSWGANPRMRGRGQECGLKILLAPSTLGSHAPKETYNIGMEIGCITLLRLFFGGSGAADKWRAPHDARTRTTYY
jgi:hypothetical protein